jgi:hypothetical protein
VVNADGGGDVGVAVDLLTDADGAEEVGVLGKAPKTAPDAGQGRIALACGRLRATVKL